MADIPITIVAGTLPAGAVYNAQTYFNAIVARMTATIGGSTVIAGQLGGTEPNAPLPGSGTTSGLWFGNTPFPSNCGIFQQWNTTASKYLPIPMVCGQYVSGALKVSEFLCGAQTGNWKIVTPDKAGTLALISDIGTQLGTQTFSGATVTVNWTTNRSPVYVTLTANTTMAYPSAPSDGQAMDFYIENPAGASFTVAWTGVVWPGGAAPTQSISSGGNRVIDHYRLYIAGDTIFGQVVNQGYPIAPGSQPTHVPVIVKQNANQNLIYLQSNYNLIAMLPPISDFSVIVNGVGVAAAQALVSGIAIFVQMPSNFAASDIVTISYLGTDIKSLAGLAMAGFSNLSVPIVNSGTPSAPGGGAGVFNHYLN